MKAASAQLDRAQKDLERTKIRAPFDGRVRRRVVGLGQAVRNVTVLGTIFASDYAEVRLPISGTDLPLLQLPEAAGDPPVAVVLRDALNPENETEWEASIIRTEGALDASSLELFGIARVDDPFGQITGKPPLRIGQPVTAIISGHVLKGVMALPRIAVRQLDQIYLVDGKKLTLKNMTIDPIWSNEAHIIIRDPEIVDGDLLATTHLVYAPDGARVEILPGIESPVGNKTPLAGGLTKDEVKSPSKGSGKGGKF
jgi:membrane fusion protein, multidrug efflux system